MSESILLNLLQQSLPSQAVLQTHTGDRSLADTTRYPFLAIVGQEEMKTALILALINPAIGGVLLSGPRGTAKTTAVRGLADLLPQVQRSTCPNGCEPQAAQAGDVDAICPDCVAKLEQGLPITAPDRMRLVELPLNARLEDVVGSVTERSSGRKKPGELQRGILASTDQNVLYVDEVNLLDNAIANAILDAAAQGVYTVRRGALSATYRARLMLIGSMNPEEGPLRPQLHDRFGLRVVVRGLTAPKERMELYRRVQAYRTNPHMVRTAWADETLQAAAEIARARELLPQVGLETEVEECGLRWIERLQIESNRAEIALFEAARAHAAADARPQASLDDLRAVAPLALRQRRSAFMTEYFARQAEEDQHIAGVIGEKSQDTFTRTLKRTDNELPG
jgi:magnesium chelatase subunit I